MKLDQARCNSILRIRSRQSCLYHVTPDEMMTPFFRRIYARAPKMYQVGTHLP
jgi:hypothetical protein